MNLEACNNELDVGGERKRSSRDDPVASDLSHHWYTMMIKKRKAKWKRNVQFSTCQLS